MSEIPHITLGHVGLYVGDLATMTDFYTRILGFTVTDSGRGGAGEFSFLSRDPGEHHQVVLVTGRPPESFGTVNQVSFRVASAGDLRALHERLAAAGVEGITPIDHGNAWSVYFDDPEGNRLEVYWPTPWYVRQPHAEPLDLALSDQALAEACERNVRRNPTFRPAEAWRAETAARMGRDG